MGLPHETENTAGQQHGRTKVERMSDGVRTHGSMRYDSGTRDYRGTRREEGSDMLVGTEPP